MGTITCTEIINKAAIQLLDTANIRWTRAELLGWLNDGQRAIVLIQPNASSFSSPFQLVAGTRQTLPPGAYILLDIVRNLGANGTTPGRAIRVVSRQLLDAQDPFWHTRGQSASVTNYMYDVQDTTSFYVYPPSNGQNKIELNYSVTPANITDETQPIVVKDIFQTALVDYVLYRANSKDAEYAPGMQLAQAYLQTFQMQMGVEGKEEGENNPNQTLGGGNAQPVPGANS